MAVGEALPNCTGTGTSADPYKYSTAEGFKEAIAVVDAYVVAAEENLVFDVNDGVIPSSLSIACNSLNGKGTTIRNLYRTTEGALISTSDSNKNTYISNMNFYNMMLVNNIDNAQIRVINTYNNDYRVKNFTNCNFTGIVRGSKIHFYNGLITSNSNSYTSPDQGFYNCTFNFNIEGSQYSSYASNYGLFWSNDNNYVMSNCTICISGKFNYDFYLVNNYHMINCTIMNKATNPIVIEGNRTISITQRTAEYNYIKPYITQSSGNTVTLAVGNNASKTLVNRSRLPVNTIISGTCINMQETDATQSDYIYNAQNLADAGFLVGTVIE